MPNEMVPEEIPETNLPLDPGCIIAGAAVTGWMSILTFILKPLGVILAIALLLAVAVIPVGWAAWTLMIVRMEITTKDDILMAILTGITGTLLALAIMLTILQGIVMMWEKHGLQKARSCQQEKTKRQTEQQEAPS